MQTGEVRLDPALSFKNCALAASILELDANRNVIATLPSGDRSAGQRWFLENQ